MDSIWVSEAYDLGSIPSKATIKSPFLGFFYQKSSEIIKCQKFSIFVSLKAKYKIIFSSLLLAVVLFAALPKVYIHSLLGHTHSVVNTVTDIVSVSEQEGTQDCNFEKFDTPVYYTVFKFILNFLPIKETKQTSFFYHQKSIHQHHYNTSLLRGPPVA